MKNTLVTVIIPCYNYAEYVEEAIKSVAQQTHKLLDIVVINDGSTDNSDQVIKKLNRKYTFRYVYQENKGIVATRNKGVSLAQGDYIIQLDADDWLEGTYIEEVLSQAKKGNLDIVYTQAAFFGRENFTSDFPEFNLEYLKHNNFMHASALVKKSIFRDRQYDEYLTDKWYEDWDIFLDACLDGAQAGLVNKPLLHYRKHDNKLSRSDDFDNKLKEALVRHHILSKQNAKHPDHFWYFSPEIVMLKNYIDQLMKLSSENQRLSHQNEEYRVRNTEYLHRLQKIEATLPYKIYRKAKKIIS